MSGYCPDCGNTICVCDDLKDSLDLGEYVENLTKQVKLLEEALKFYSNPENWSRRESFFWESIDRADCKNYPHITRDVRLTGGHKARSALYKLNKLRRGYYINQDMRKYVGSTCAKCPDCGFMNNTDKIRCEGCGGRI